MASNKGRIHAWISFSFVHVIVLHFFVFVYIAWVPSDPLVKKEQILTSSFVLLELVFIFGILIEMPNSKQECSLQFAFFMVWNALFSLILSRGINDFFRNFADFVWPPFVWVYAGFHWRWYLAWDHYRYSEYSFNRSTVWHGDAQACLKEKRQVRDFTEVGS
jgi:hypothetical protein